MSDARDNIINLFEKGPFPYKGNVFKTKEKESKKERTKTFRIHSGWIKGY